MIKKITVLKIIVGLLIPIVLLSILWHGHNLKPVSKNDFIKSLQYTQVQSSQEDFKFVLEGKVIDSSGKENYKYKLDNEFDYFIELPYKEDIIFLAGEIYTVKYQSSKYYYKNYFSLSFLFKDLNRDIPFGTSQQIYYLPFASNDRKTPQEQITEFKNNKPRFLYEEYVKEYSEGTTKDSPGIIYGCSFVFLIIYIALSVIVFCNTNEEEINE